jgi:hypothetical protein
MTKGLQEGRSLQLLSPVDAPKILRTASASQPRQVAPYISVQNALGTQHLNERQVRTSNSQKTMTLKGSSEGENDALKPSAQAINLLVLGARALIDIVRG